MRLGPLLVPKCLHPLAFFYWSDGPRLVAPLHADFGDLSPDRRYAERRDGVLLDRLKKPATTSVCRLGHCREFYHEFEVRLPERNQRTVALTGGRH